MTAQAAATSGCVLLVEDDNALRRAMGRFMRLDHEVLEAATVGAALDIIQRTPRVAAVVTDWNLETRDDGLRVVEAAQAAHVGVVVVTGDVISVRDALRRHADHRDVQVFDKPFDASALRAAVTELIAQHQRQQP